MSKWMFVIDVEPEELRQLSDDLDRLRKGLLGKQCDVSAWVSMYDAKRIIDMLVSNLSVTHEVMVEVEYGAAYFTKYPEATNFDLNIIDHDVEDDSFWYGSDEFYVGLVVEAARDLVILVQNGKAEEVKAGTQFIISDINATLGTFDLAAKDETELKKGREVWKTRYRNCDPRHFRPVKDEA